MSQHDGIDFWEEDVDSLPSASCLPPRLARWREIAASFGPATLR
jgi:hypothetical protein